MRQDDAKCIEDNCGAMFARSLCLNKIAEFIQLEIRGKNAAHTPSQRRAQGDHRRADTERSIVAKRARGFAAAYRGTSFVLWRRSHNSTDRAAGFYCRARPRRRAASIALRPHSGGPG